jgi:hypothetical protein
MPPNESPYARDRREADAFMPEIRKELGFWLILPSSDHADRNHNSDLHVDESDIAVRVRKRWVFEHPEYRYQFTVRKSRPSGVLTENDKYQSGLGDFLFYGFGDYVTTELLAYRIVDLSALRVSGVPPRKADIPNDDGTTFDAYDIRDLKGAPSVIRARLVTRIGFEVLGALTWRDGAA